MANKDILGLGKDADDVAKAIGISGTEGDKIIVSSLDNSLIYNKILIELKKFNMNFETMTGVRVTNADINSYISKLL
jgi:hypothetical protein